MTEENIQEAGTGSAAPDFRLSASNGAEIGLEDFQEKANVVLFFVREYG